MTLPVGFSPLPFSAARGIPQTVPFESYRVTLVASTSDLPALLQTSITETVIDMNARCSARPVTVPVDERELFRSPAPSTIDAIRPMVIVRENDTLIGSLPALVGTVLRFGLVDTLAVEIWIDTFVLAAASLTQPGDVGAQLSIGIRRPA
jgi:hypothetical protein